MNTRSLYYLAAGIGGTIGGFVPALWGGSLFGGWAVLISGVGGILGIWVIYKYNH